jgi:PIN domain nuclease of toxin-antitoxin system
METEIDLVTVWFQHFPINERASAVNRSGSRSCVAACSTASLPMFHKGPIDRMLAAQVTVEGVTLLTTDSVLAQYPGPTRLL